MYVLLSLTETRVFCFFFFFFFVFFLAFGCPTHSFDYFSAELSWAELCVCFHIVAILWPLLKLFLFFSFWPHWTPLGAIAISNSRRRWGSETWGACGAVPWRFLYYFFISLPICLISSRLVRAIESFSQSTTLNYAIGRASRANTQVRLKVHNATDDVLRFQAELNEKA